MSSAVASAISEEQRDELLAQITPYHAISNGLGDVGEAYFLIQWFYRILTRLDYVEKWTPTLVNKWKASLLTWIEQLMHVYVLALGPILNQTPKPNKEFYPSMQQLIDNMVGRYKPSATFKLPLTFSCYTVESIYEAFFALVTDDTYRWNKYGQQAFDTLWNLDTSCEMAIIYESEPVKLTFLRTWRSRYLALLDDYEFMLGYRLKRPTYIFTRTSFDEPAQFISDALGIPVSIRKDTNDKQGEGLKNTETETETKSKPKPIKRGRNALEQDDKEEKDRERSKTKTTTAAATASSSKTKELERLQDTVNEVKNTFGASKTRRHVVSEVEFEELNETILPHLQPITNGQLFAALGELDPPSLSDLKEDVLPLNQRDKAQYDRIVRALSDAKTQGLWIEPAVSDLPISISSQQLRKLRQPTELEKEASEQSEYLWLDQDLIKLGLVILEQTIVPRNKWDAGFILLDLSFYDYTSDDPERRALERADKFKNELIRMKARWPNVKRVSQIFFICQNEAKNHWAVAELFPVMRNSAFYDSYVDNVPGINHKAMLEEFISWYIDWCSEQRYNQDWIELDLPELPFVDLDKWNPPYIPKAAAQDFLDQQEPFVDTMNCGLFVLKYVEYRIRAIPLWVQSTAMGIFRQRLLLNSVRLIVASRKRRGQHAPVPPARQGRAALANPART